MTLAPGMNNQLVRDPGAVNDSKIVHDRHPYYQRARFVPQGQAEVDWTRSGPRRPDLHMRNMTYARQQGSTASRFPVVDSPTTGRHTDTPNATSRTLPRYVMTPQMIPGRVNRLSAAVYSGQTYSQTTVPQGGGRPR